MDCLRNRIHFFLLVFLQTGHFGDITGLVMSKTSTFSLSFEETILSAADDGSIALVSERETGKGGKWFDFRPLCGVFSLISSLFLLLFFFF